MAVDDKCRGRVMNQAAMTMRAMRSSSDEQDDGRYVTYLGAPARYFENALIVGLQFQYCGTT
jgi:hypothetical protein